MPILLCLLCLAHLAAAGDSCAVIETKFGKIAFEFFPDKAPKHVAHFVTLAHEKFFDGTTFHRVVPGFMIQGGDPATKDSDRMNDGQGLPGQETVPAEFNGVKHVRGVVSMARKKNKDSATSQFFIVVAEKEHLNGQYTAFGKVVRGMEVVDAIVSQKADRRDNPLDRIEMKVSIVPLTGLAEALR